MRRALSAAVLAATLFVLLVGVPADAATTQETIIQDDPLLLSAETQEEVDDAFSSFKEIGIDRVRVSLFWDHVAPERLSQVKPPFSEQGPSSPAAYPAGSWARYDRIVLAAQKTGVGLLFSVTGPGPAWATPGRKCAKAGPFLGCQEGVFRPDPDEFRDFVTAAGTRYSGSYPLALPPDRDPDPDPDDSGKLGLPGIDDLGRPPPPKQPVKQPLILPRVDHWSIWNEPNFPAWLLPVWRANKPKTAARMVPAAPAHYRRLVDSAYLGLDATGHGGDTILIGETAPRGVKNPKQLGKAMMPAEFARELFCLKASYRPYTGKAARLRGCPVTGAERARFTSDHAGLFRAQGWAHHPYSLDAGTWRVPTWRHPLRDNVSIGSLDRLTRTLDRSTRAWTRSSPRKAIWMTEYGYQTTPPDPTAGVSPGRQGRLGAWGESLAYRNPRVASFAQFLLFDDKPLAGLAESDPRRWVTWQSGLLTAEGQSKPHFDDFRLPLHVASRGRMARVFGIFRPAVTDTALTAEIQFAPSGGPWRALRTVTVTNPRGYLDTRVRVPRAGRVRLVWQEPGTGDRLASRSAPAG